MEEEYVSLKQSEYAEMVEQIESESRPTLGVILAILFGIVGAIVWAVVVKVTGYNVGIVAIAVGFLVSEGFVRAGRGTSKVIGIVAGIIALLSIFLGEILATLFILSEYWGISFLETVQSIYIGEFLRLVVESTEPFNIIFYFIALKYAYKRSFVDVYALDIMIEPDAVCEG